MIHPFQGPYTYDKNIVEKWDSSAIGVYYCGLLTTTGLYPLYIGVSTGDTGIRGRLLDHFQEDSHWHDVTHFGFYQCDTAEEARVLEAQEIPRHRPKYNKRGK